MAYEAPDGLELERVALFDADWYGTAGLSAEEAFAGFLALGSRAENDPHPLFSVAHYLAQAPELIVTGESPLVHYLREGWHRGLSPHPLFEPAFYARTYHRALQPGEDPLTHYLRVGESQGLKPSPWFDPYYYNHHNPDVSAGGTKLLVHYAVFGGREGRKPHTEFDPQVHVARQRLPKTANPLIDFMRRLRRTRAAAVQTENPRISIVILNYNKPLMTVQAVVEILGDKHLGPDVEVVVVDNGSDAENYALLRTVLPPAARLLRLDVNRFFGEGNNLGAEIARGEILVFLNNDAFIDAAAIETLSHVLLENEDCGAVGPRFVYPDGRLQEAGATVSPCGIAVQRGKFLSPSTGMYRRTEPVDYVSAACVMLRRETFDEVGGFDLIWEPAYYEDADLGLKVALAGKRVYYCADATVMHVENTTSGDERLALRMDGIVEVNREKFIGRWSEYLAAGKDAEKASVRFPPRAQRSKFRPAAVIYTPYPLYPGGGERYLLTIAQALAPSYDVYLATPEAYSTWRIRTLARDLRLDLSHVTPIAQRDLEHYRDCAVFIAMGNELFPMVPPQGHRAIYHCQFPFGMVSSHVLEYSRNLAGYEAVIVNSEFTARNYREEATRYGEPAPPVFVIAPPVPAVPAHDANVVPGRILHVGRFTSEGHSKRQDVLIEAFRRLLASYPDAELHLAGAVPAAPVARDYVIALRRAAMNLPVTLHLNIAPEQLDELYRTSGVYWHATGYSENGVILPQMQEHFGISIVEAMSAGAVPFVFNGGGPPEYIDPGINGFVWRSQDDLVRQTVEFLRSPLSGKQSISAAARATAAVFDPNVFEREVRAIASGVSVAPGIEAAQTNGSGSRNGHAAPGAVVESGHP